MGKKQTMEPLFDLENVFEVDDYLFAYGDDLTEERTEAEVESIISLLGLVPPMKILDLACGFGRHANRLAKMGHSVTGVDYMAGFLAIAREKAAEMGVQVDYRQGDMRQIDFQDEFDRATLMFTGFGYFEDNENELVIQKIAQALKPGGSLMLDTLNRDAVFQWLVPAEVIDKGKDLLINRISFDTLSGRLHNRRIVIRDGVRKDKPYTIRLYNASEMQSLLERAGLVEPRLLGNDGQPLSKNNGRRLIVIAKKPTQRGQA
jgi:SAM-dependent methyltransferase